MKKLLPFICIMILLMVSGCSTQKVVEDPLSSERTEELYALTQQFTDYLDGNNIDAAMAMMNETMIEAMDGKLAGAWTGLADVSGAFVETGTHAGMFGEGYEALEMTLVFEKGNMIQRVVFDSDNLITGLWFRKGTVSG